MTIILIVVLVALVFEYINGFHDTANSIATVVSTKVLTPRQAVAMAAATNLLGALWGTAVAKTISSGLVDAQMVSLTSGVIICALLGAIAWNLLTWWFGLPSSSSHALIGGMVGAALAASDLNCGSIVWAHSCYSLGKNTGVFLKVLLPVVAALGALFLLGLLIMGALMAI